jgi:hypothetical protein
MENKNVEEKKPWNSTRLYENGNYRTAFALGVPWYPEYF